MTSTEEPKYHVLYDNGDGVFFYWGPNGGSPVAVDEAVTMSPAAVIGAVSVLMTDVVDRVVVEKTGVSAEDKPGPVPVWVYDREDADPVHDVLDASVAVYSRGGRHDTESVDGAWVEVERPDWYELRWLANKYPGLVTLRPSIRGS